MMINFRRLANIIAALFIDSLRDIGAWHGILTAGYRDIWPPRKKQQRKDTTHKVGKYKIKYRIIYEFQKQEISAE